MPKKPNDLPGTPSNAANAGVDQTVSEGSTVVLGAKTKDAGGENLSYSWKQISGSPVRLVNENSPNASFQAPYIADKAISNALEFELTVTKGSTVAGKDSVEITVRRVQRALIFQGGGALGAYEAGVYRALCETLREKDSKNGVDRPLFDIVAGSSIGAVNAAILVNFVVHKNGNNWDHSEDELGRFWSDISNPNPFHLKWWIDNVWLNPMLMSWWDYWKNIRDTGYRSQESSGDDGSPKDWREIWPFIAGYFFWPENWGPLATSESARRFYSYWWSIQLGVPKVLSAGPIVQPDMKFFAPTPQFIRFDNNPLAQTMMNYWPLKNRIKTSYEKGQPRLILVSVDVQDCTTAVAFDSYEYRGKECEVCDQKFGSTAELVRHVYDEHKQQNEARTDSICKTVYGGENVRVMHYDGIGIEHVAASMSTHLRYKYPALNVVEDGKESPRYFWDGAYLSNTPLREVIQAHQNYWREAEGVPELEVYIVNLYPSIEKQVPQDADSIQDREIDIKFHDRTKYDAKAAATVTDYLDLGRLLKNVASEAIQNIADDDRRALMESKLRSVLYSETKTRKRNGEKRIYRDILEGRFSISKTVYIERADDSHTIFGKAFDFSSKTVDQLLKSGYDEAMTELGLDQLMNKTGESIKDKKLQRMESKLQVARALARNRNEDGSIVDHDKFASMMEDFKKETNDADLIAMADKVIESNRKDVKTLSTWSLTR